MKIAKRFRLVPALALAVAACSAPAAIPDPPVTHFGPYRVNTAPEPTSTDDVSVIGGASWPPTSADEIGAQAELAIEAVVKDVHKSRLNTEDGLYPTPEMLLSTDNNLTALTDVEMEVLQVLNAAASALQPDQGDSLIITLGGGYVETTLDLTLEQSKALGFTVTDPKDESVEVPVDGDYKLTWGHAPGESLTEGDRVVLFLVKVEIPGYADAPAFSYWSPLHPSAVFRPAPSGMWTADGLDGVYDVDEIASLMASHG